MTSSAPPDVAALVEQFFRRRGEGRRVSVDDVLAEAGAHPDAQGRAALIDTISRRARRSSFRTTISLEPSQGGAADAPEFALAEIPGYDLIEEIGRGGMGAVYEAYQQSTGRRVAVKLISQAIAGSESARRRFEREVELVARLQHPNIVSVLDSGLHQGRYFYVMEYVEGRTLDEHLRNAETPKSARGGSAFGGHRNAETKDVLALIAKICDAVEYAHQRGVLHRDLKPSNILVVDVGSALRTMPPTDPKMVRNADPTAQPRILDFGLAKDIDPLAVERRALTLAAPGQILGTLAYMAPEQARGAHEETSVRSDVYSLGAIAYEAVTGRLPCPTDGALHDVLDRIQRQDPPRPSSLIRGTSADVDAILLKALDKAPERRYATAGDLAADLRRWLSDKPVAARPASTFYQFRKFARRNRGLVGGVVVTLTLVVLGTIGTSWQAYRATNAEKRARDERDQAQREADKAQELNAFLQQMLATANSEAANRKDVSVRQILDEAAQLIEAKFKDRPEVEAAIRGTIGDAYVGLGLYDSARPHLQRALQLRQERWGDSHLEVAASMYDLAKLFSREARHAEAESLYRQALAIQRQIQGPEHPGVVVAMGGLAWMLYSQGNWADAEPIFEQVLGLQRGKPDAGEMGETLNNLGLLLRDQGRFAEAESRFHEALERWRQALGENHARPAMAMENLATTLAIQGKLDEAEPLLRQVLQLRRGRLEEDHPLIASALDNLANLLHEQGRNVEAEPLCREALAIRRKRLGNEHPEVANSLHNLANLLSDQTQSVEAESLLREALEIRRERFGNRHEAVAANLCNLGILLHQQGRLVEAEPLLREALDIQTQHPGHTPYLTFNTLTDLAALLEDRELPRDALPLRRQALALTREQFGDSHSVTLDAQYALAMLLQKESNSEEAEQLLVAALHTLENSPGDQAAPIHQALTDLVEFYVGSGDFQRAESLLLKRYERIRSDPAPALASLNDSLQRLVKLYESWDAAEPNRGYDAKAAEWRAKLGEWQASTQPAPSNSP